ANDISAGWARRSENSEGKSFGDHHNQKSTLIMCQLSQPGERLDISQEIGRLNHNRSNIRAHPPSKVVAIYHAIFLKFQQFQTKVLVPHVSLNDGPIFWMYSGCHQEAVPLRKPGSHKNGLCQSGATVIHGGI